MKKALFLVMLIPLVVLGCTSTGDTFLVKNLDDQGKAAALTAAGIDEYQIHLVNRQEFDQIPRIKEYFTTALGFDPGNTQAQQYLVLIDNFKNQKLKTNIASATKALAKPKRTDDDNYTLFVSLQTAYRIDSANTAVQKMLSDTAQDRAKLIDSYLAKAKTSLAAIDDKTPDAAREKQYGEAYPNVSKALAMDPANTAARGQMSIIKTEVGKLVEKRVAAYQKLIAISKFVDARTQVTALNDLNRKTGNSYDAEVRGASYALNFTWAKALFAQKDYANADARNDAALSATRTADAIALKRQLAEIRGKADTAASFDAAIKDIDQLTTSGQLVAAQRKIDALARTTTDQAKQAALDEKSQIILGKIKDVYAQGVDAYRNEDYKNAIDLLQTVVGVKVDYEQAGDYLDKARAKQKVIDSLGG
jgi:hypothetical protein